MSEQSPSRLLDKIIIRVPNGMRERIRRVADRNGRSVNAELLTLLERAYPSDARLDEVVHEIVDLVKTFPANRQNDVWRNVIEKLEAIRQETE